MSINEAQMIAYAALPDEALSDLARRGDRDAEEVLIKRYNRVVRQLARPYYLAGGDSDDLIQEGMIGLYGAISAYREELKKPFRNFACTCVERRILDACRVAWRKVPLDGEAFDPESFSEGVTPEDTLLFDESNAEFYGKLMRSLSDFEFRVMAMYLEGMSYSAIAETTGKDMKSIDNALARSKKKLQKTFRS